MCNDGNSDFPSSRNKYVELHGFSCFFFITSQHIDDRNDFKWAIYLCFKWEIVPIWKVCDLVPENKKLILRLIGKNTIC